MRFLHYQNHLLTVFRFTPDTRGVFRCIETLVYTFYTQGRFTTPQITEARKTQHNTQFSAFISDVLARWTAVSARSFHIKKLNSKENGCISLEFEKKESKKKSSLGACRKKMKVSTSG